MQASFGHLSGYGAGYYSYLFCRVFSANIWHRCFEHDPLNRQSTGITHASSSFSLF
jgi:Zn-dependent oligopeptidase